MRSRAFKQFCRNWMRNSGRSSQQLQQRDEKRIEEVSLQGARELCVHDYIQQIIYWRACMLGSGFGSPLVAT